MPKRILPPNHVLLDLRAQGLTHAAIAARYGAHEKTVIGALRRAGVPPRQNIPPEVRFWAKVNKDGPVPDYAPHLGPCWVWTASTDDAGYGQFGIGVGNVVKAYRWAWEQEHGPVLVGLCLDHLCRVRACVRPSHLEPVTQRENVLRGVSPAARAATVTHCPRNHPYTGDNLIMTPDGHRACRECSRRRQRVDPDVVLVKRLDLAVVAEIRRRYAAGGISQAALGREYGIAQQSVGRIVRGERYRDDLTAYVSGAA